MPCCLKKAYLEKMLKLLMRESYRKRNRLLLFYLIIILICVFCSLSFSSCKGSFFSDLVKDKNNKETNLITDKNQAELETEKKEETLTEPGKDIKEQEQKQQDNLSEEQSTKDSKAEDKTGQENNTEQIDISNQIIVISPKPNQIVYSPLVIEGKARGTWYFEADFPVKLLDANKNIIAEHYAQALGDWMTEDFVPFRSVIEFEKPKTESGILVLEKDNPAGLPEYDAKLEIPVIFGTKTSKIIEDTDPQKGEYFVYAILKSVDLSNNKITVKQLINEPNEKEISPEVILSNDCQIVKIILQRPEEKEIISEINLKDIPIEGEIGIIFKSDNTARAIIYQEIITLNK